MSDSASGGCKQCRGRGGRCVDTNIDVLRSSARSLQEVVPYIRSLTYGLQVVMTRVALILLMHCIIRWQRGR